MTGRTLSQESWRVTQTVTHLVVSDPPDQDVVILPVAVHTLHHAVQLSVVSQDAILVSELLPQLVVQSHAPASSDRSEVEERQPGLARVLSARVR